MCVGWGRMATTAATFISVISKPQNQQRISLSLSSFRPSLHHHRFIISASAGGGNGPNNKRPRNGGGGGKGGGGGGNRRRWYKPPSPIYVYRENSVVTELFEWFDRVHVDIRRTCLTLLAYIYGFYGLFHIFLHVIGFNDSDEKTQRDKMKEEDNLKANESYGKSVGGSI